MNKMVAKLLLKSLWRQQLQDYIHVGVQETLSSHGTADGAGFTHALHRGLLK